ncbi:MAG: hypothetical protein NVS3B5_01370 [Sphingomicrobium sp.]
MTPHEATATTNGKPINTVRIFEIPFKPLARRSRLLQRTKALKGAAHKPSEELSFQGEIAFCAPGGALLHKLN